MVGSTKTMRFPPEKLLRAKWVCTLDGPPIRNGAVGITGGTILDVGTFSQLRARAKQAEVIDYGDAALLPGLINPHTHLELTNRPRIEFDGDIAGWLLGQRPPAGLTPQQHQAEVESATRAGIAQCLKFGVTCIGDISAQPQWTRPIIASSPLRATSFGEVLGLGKLRQRCIEQIERATDVANKTPRLRVGIGPHSPYTLDVMMLESCVRTADAFDIPLSIHLAEFREETEFLSTHSGVFRRLWERANLWTDDVPLGSQTPIELAVDQQLLDQPDLLVHVNYVTDAEIQTLANGRANVVFCPRTHAYFRHPPHRWHDMLMAGINVAVGTDSCASSPDLNIVDDLRLLRRQNRSTPVEVLWSLVTRRAAIALSIGGHGLSQGCTADVVAFAAKSDDPLAEILDTDASLPIAVWIDGKLASN